MQGAFAVPPAAPAQAAGASVKQADEVVTDEDIAPAAERDAGTMRAAAGGPAQPSLPRTRIGTAVSVTAPATAAAAAAPAAVTAPAAAAAAAGPPAGAWPAAAAGDLGAAAALPPPLGIAADSLGRAAAATAVQGQAADRHPAGTTAAAAASAAASAVPARGPHARRQGKSVLTDDDLAAYTRLLIVDPSEVVDPVEIGRQFLTARGFQRSAVADLAMLLAELVGPDEDRAEVVADAMSACHRSNVGAGSECLLAAGLIGSDRRRRRSDVAGHEARRRRRT
jgi:hypothetical protein